ncbi:MAG TPA: ABC transporter ATP-binding protein [Thermoproteales archaeon]|nr:ABC transporter ATP-binding protein [Thermoproteales archaeon]
MPVEVVLERLWKNFGDFLIRDITLRVEAGDYFVVLGPSGAGKTLLLQLIAGIYKPDKGRIYFGDRDVTYTPPEKRGVGYLPQTIALFPNMNVYENIAFPLRIRKLPEKEVKERVLEVSESLGIRNLLGRDIRTLSGGEAQRVALARALIARPNVLLLDEPLSSVDPVLRWDLRDFLRRIHREFNITVIHVTHDFTEALSLASRIAVMSKGMVVQVGSPGEIFYKPKSRFVAWFTRTENIFQGEAYPHNEYSVVYLEGKVELIVPGRYSGKVTVTFRPESILVSKKKVETSARNVFKGKVIDYVDEGALILLKINVNDLTFKAYITKSSFKELELRRDSVVFLSLKASEVNVIPC